MSLKNLKKEFNWIFTKCRAKFKGHKEANYTFYIVDYIYGEHPMGVHITELRNKGLIKTAYFMDESRAGMFIHTEGGRITISEANDKVFVKSIKKFMPMMIANILGKDEEVSNNQKVTKT